MSYASVKMILISCYFSMGEFTGSRDCLGLLKMHDDVLLVMHVMSTYSVDKITEKAVCRSVFLTIWFRLFFWQFLPTVKRLKLIWLIFFAQIFLHKFYH